jgi:hypothetical protein
MQVLFLCEMFVLKFILFSNHWNIMLKKGIFTHRTIIIITDIMEVVK